MLASKKEWGQSAWKFMHILACKVKPTEFNNQKEAIINIIKGICTNVPCSDCRQHAERQMRQLHVSSIRNQEDLILMLHDFHNKVNIRTQKPVFKKEELEIYKKMSTKEVVINFMNTWYAGSSTPRLMMDTFARVRFLGSLKTYFDSNQLAFQE
jgi:hypothetical protein|tara:strand:+ start:343 stop:804 length:462 start_codon:yes stop_codon:yes gene_type:complete